VTAPDPGQVLWAESFAEAVDDVQSACLADGLTLSDTERLMMEAGCAAGVSAAMVHLAKVISSHAAR
jgi:hypothetical protein